MCTCNLILLNEFPEFSWNILGKCNCMVFFAESTSSQWLFGAHIGKLHPWHAWNGVRDWEHTMREYKLPIAVYSPAFSTTCVHEHKLIVDGCAGSHPIISLTFLGACCARGVVICLLNPLTLYQLEEVLTVSIHMKSPLQSASCAFSVEEHV